MSNDTIPCPVPFRMWNIVWLLITVSTVENCGIDIEANMPPINAQHTINMQLFDNAINKRFPHLDIDMSKLLQEHASICPYLSRCDSEHLHAPLQVDLYDQSKVNVTACRPCDCSFQCLETRNCCPGNAYQYLPYEYFSRTVYDRLNLGEQDMTYMIAECPVSYKENTDVINRCSGDDSVLYPISSITTMLTYKNKFCAQCHNDTNFLGFWKLNTYCLTAPNSVLAYTADEVLNGTTCDLMFDPDPSFSIKTISVPNGIYDYAIGTCNVTGLWNKFDPQINWACENMEYLYKTFKNVFCYICNPGISSTQTHALIDTCNVTGKWVLMNLCVQSSCLLEPQTPRLFPYKNIHCMICNGMDNNMNGNNFDVSIVENSYPPRIGMTLQFNKDNSQIALAEILALLNTTGIRPTTPGKLHEKNKITNISYVIDRYESICGGQSSCPSESPGTNWQCESKPDEYEWCSCMSGCAEDLKCCPLVLLKVNPYSCASVLSFPRWKATISKTAQDSEPDGNIIIIDECLTDNSEDMFHSFFKNISTENWQSIPARTSGEIIYKNLTYLLCNSVKQTAYIDLELHCNTYIDYSQFVSITHLLQTAKEYCSIYFLPSNTKTCKQINTNMVLVDIIRGRDEFSPTRNISQSVKSAIDSAYISAGNDTYSKCNQTKRWQSEQTDIKLVCEGFNPLWVYQINGFTYKNFACFLCNPLVTENEVDHVISTCNVTGAWESSNLDMIEQCRTTEYQERWLPFKNFFCSECNLPSVKIISVNEQKTIMYLFSISEEEWRLLSGVVNEVEWCLDETSAITENTCHNVLCSTGHFLEDGECKTFYNELNSIYTISFELRVHEIANENGTGCHTSNHQHFTIATDLKFLIDQVAENIIDTLDRSTIYSYFYNGTVDATCDDVMSKFHITASSRILFSLTCGYNGENMTDIEQLLVAILDREYTLYITPFNDVLSQCKVPFQIFQKSWIGTQYNNPFNLLGQIGPCYYSKMLPPFFDEQTAGHVRSATATFVDRFLLCPQLEFVSDEYHYDNVTDIITLIDSRITLAFGYFKRHGTAIRICLADYKKKLQLATVVVVNSLIKAYHLFSNILISISLTSLALTFGTYCMFPCLRTIPGKNIMVLTFCLFCAQALLVFALRLESNSFICQTMGILIHYIWLATFFAMNTCSFHLFKIFYIDTLSKASFNNSNKRFLYYLLYTFGMPLLIVATTVCTHAIPSNGQSVGYGKLLCFLSDVNTSLVAFITPAVLVFSSNIILFSLAFYKIRTTAKVQTSRKEERQDLVICIKMCTIIGVTWPLQLLDSFIGFSYFSFVVEGINSLQGVFIFVSYVCNARILALFRKTINSKPKRNVSLTQSTSVR